MARRYGADDDMIEALGDPASTRIDAAGRCALRFAEDMTRNASGLDESRTTELLDYFSQEQVVELICVIGLFNYLNRFAEATGLWPTRPGEGGPEKG